MQPPVDASPFGYRLVGAGVLTAAAALFASTWTNAMQVADSAELVAVACNLGVAHPPGYPLYSLIGHGFCELPWWSPAGRLSLMSACAGLVAVGFVYATVVRLTACIWGAAIAALVLATGSVFWRYCSLPEVFALHAALGAAVVYAAVRVAQCAAAKRRWLWIATASLLFGFGLSNHQSTVLLGPLVLTVLIVPRDGFARTAGRLGLAAIALAVGLLPYLYLLAADPLALPRWGQTSDFQGLLHHVLRRDYGTFALALGHDATPLSSLSAWFGSLPAQTGYLLLVAAALGLVLLLRRSLAAEIAIPRQLGLALATTAFVCGPLFLLLFNVDATGIGGQVVERFFVLPAVMWAVLLGIGLGAANHRWLSAQSPARRWLYRSAALALVGISAMLNYARADVRYSYSAEDAIRNALDATEHGALVLGIGDVRLFGMAYLQRVLGVRSDVQYVDVKMLLYPWYVKQQRRLYPRFDYHFQPGNVDTIALIRRAQRRGTPVYLAVVYNDQVRRAFASYPVGPLMRLLGPHEPMPPLQEIVAQNVALDRQAWRRGHRPDPAVDPWSAFLIDPFAMRWQALARVLMESGHTGQAKRAAARARSWAPWL